MTNSSIRFLQELHHTDTKTLVLEYCPHNSRFYFRILYTLRSAVADDDLSAAIAAMHLHIILP